MRYVPPAKTKLTPEQAAELLRDGWTAVTGEVPNGKTLALLMAKSGLETNEWQKMWNWNFGNVKALGKYSGAYTCINVSEILKGVEVWFRPEGRLDAKGGVVVGERFEVPTDAREGVFGHPQTRMRAYSDGLEGARRYALALKLNFPVSYESARRGADPEAFVLALESEEYFTANVDLYVKGTKWRYGLYERIAHDAVGEALPRPTLRVGSKGSDVEDWQQFALGWDQPKRDGLFGPKTEHATKDWQKVHSLPETGVVDAACWMLVDASAGAKA